jgi:hypothetical protein
MTKYKIKDNETLVRDAETNAVLNTDVSSLERYRMRRDIENKKEKEIQKLRDDIDDIKSLLTQLIAEKNK